MAGKVGVDAGGNDGDLAVDGSGHGIAAVEFDAIKTQGGHGTGYRRFGDNHFEVEQYAGTGYVLVGRSPSDDYLACLVGIFGHQARVAGQDPFGRKSTSAVHFNAFDGQDGAIETNIHAYRQDIVARLRVDLHWHAHLLAGGGFYRGHTQLCGPGRRYQGHGQAE